MEKKKTRDRKERATLETDRNYDCNRVGLNEFCVVIVIISPGKILGIGSLAFILSSFFSISSLASLPDIIPVELGDEDLALVVEHKDGTQHP